MIVVIGGGPAGRYAAMRLTGAGKKVLIADNRPEGLGGQCLHQGCMVICALNDVARSLEHMDVLHRSGIVSTRPEVSFPVLISRMREIIGTIAGVLDAETRDAGVSVITAPATLDGRQVSVNGEPVEAEAVIIATGTRPSSPGIDGDTLPGVYTAHTLLSMPDLPRHLIIIGGGAIATEIAYIFTVLGSQVTILARSTLLRSFPPELVREAKRELHQADILEHAVVTRITGDDRVTGVVVQSNGDTLSIGGDAVLIAAGMIPNLEGINGPELTDEGYIRITPRMETSVQGIFAVGDVTGTSWLTPLARRQGRCAAEVILGREIPAPLTVTPQAVKLRNDLAFCGETGAGGMRVAIPSPVGPGSFWAVSDRATGRTGMRVDPDTGLIKGMFQASPYAAVVSAYHALLINNRAEISQMEQFVEVHPSADGTGWMGRYLSDRILETKEKREG